MRLKSTWSVGATGESRSAVRSRAIASASPGFDLEAVALAKPRCPLQSRHDLRDRVAIERFEKDLAVVDAARIELLLDLREPFLAEPEHETAAQPATRREQLRQRVSERRQLVASSDGSVKTSST